MNTNSHGLGLNISYNMAKILGGNLTVDSELRKGSVLTLFIKAEASENPILTAVIPVKQVQKVAKAKRVPKPSSVQRKLDIIPEENALSEHLEESVASLIDADEMETPGWD